jgi:hypothetical protein
MVVPTYGQTFSPSFYLVVEVVPTDSLTNQNSNFELPFDSQAFTNYNSRRVTDAEVDIAGVGLKSNNSFNLQGLYQTEAPNVILLIIEQPASDAITGFNNIINLNYQTLTQQQFLYFNEYLLQLLPVPYLAFQLTTSLLKQRVAGLGNSSFKSLVQVFNNNDIVNGLPRLVENLQWSTYFINNSILNNYWSSYLYDATISPSPPTRPTLAADLVLPVITLIANTSTSQTWEIHFGANTYYQSYISGYLSNKATGALIPNTSIVGSRIVNNFYLFVVTGLTPNTEYIYRANTYLSNPTLTSPYQFVLATTPATDAVGSGNVAVNAGNVTVTF